MPRRVYPNLRAYFVANPDVRGMDVADAVGCSYSQLSMIKWGVREPGLKLAIAIVNYCNVPLESLIRRSQQKKAS